MNIGIPGLILVALVSVPAFLFVAPKTITIYAAGSLKAAIGDMAASYEQKHQTKVILKFGPSGSLKRELEEGAIADIFASANMEHPEALAREGWGEPVTMFARNKLCVLAQPGLKISPSSLMDTLLDERVRVGTSTPKADPGGDYAWELFKRAEEIRRGSFAVLSGKALQLSGGPENVNAPGDRNQYGWLMSEKKADIFLTYCTNAELAKREVPDLNIIRIPDELSVGADYGLVVARKASAEARQFGRYILSPEGQEILRAYGFGSAAKP